MKFIKYLSIFLCCIFLLSCSYTSPKVQKDYVYQPSNKEVGLVIGSITHNGPVLSGRHGRFSNIILGYRNTLTKESGSISTEAGSPHLLTFQKKEGDFLEIDGNLFVLELPVGVYEIYEWRTFPFNGVRNWVRKIDPPIVFKVAPGKPVYIGEIYSEAILSEKKILLGLYRRLNGIKLSVKDRRTRDTNVLKQKYKNIPSNQVIYQIASNPNLQPLDFRSLYGTPPPLHDEDEP